MCSIPSRHRQFSCHMQRLTPAMSHLSSILERDTTVTDLARSKCSFSNSAPFKKKWKSNLAGTEGFNFNHLPFALSRDCSQRKSRFEASLFHVPESISLCSEIHNNKRIYYPSAFKDTCPNSTHTHWSSLLLHTQDSVHHLPSISSHQVHSWPTSYPPAPPGSCQTLHGWAQPPRAGTKLTHKHRPQGYCLKQVIYYSQLCRKK